MAKAAHRIKSIHTSENRSIVDSYASVLDSQRARRDLSIGQSSESVDISREFARREKIRNDDAEQDIALRRKTLGVLFGFLTAETAVVFVFAFCQAVHWPFGFNLDDWSFRLLVGATIAQIALMLTIAIKYLFPQRSGKG